jgi:hypothetical protein
MTRPISNAAVLLLLALAGCEPDSAERPLATALPKEVCDQAQQALSGATRTGGVVLTSPIEALIAHEAWLQMPTDSRDALAQAMGISATCAGGTPKLQQEVVIRSETGIVLTRRVVETSASMPGL